FIDQNPVGFTSCQHKMKLLSRTGRKMAIKIVHGMNKRIDFDKHIDLFASVSLAELIISGSNIPHHHPIGMIMHAVVRFDELRR
ncbi:hypothetical protein C1X44_34845, partial [Pseudomonas sp. MPR-AND1A]